MSETLVAETDEAALLSFYEKTTPSSDFWRTRLSPYRQSAAENVDQSEAGDWPALTDCITEPLLTRITGVREEKAESDNHWSLTTTSTAPRDVDHIPGLSHREASRTQLAERELTFLPIDLKRTWRPGATGRERTDAARDWSWALNDVIANHCKDAEEMEVVGEMQFCFLMVLTLNNYSCLEQWKRILELLFNSQRAISERPELYEKALRVLRLQLQHCSDVEGGLFDLSDEEGSLLKNLLERFQRGLVSTSAEKNGEDQEWKTGIVYELEEVEEFLTSEYGWDFQSTYLRSGVLELEDGETVDMDLGSGKGDDGYNGYGDGEEEAGEYAPVLVELTAEQQEMLGNGNDELSHGNEHVREFKTSAKLKRIEESERSVSDDISDVDDDEQNLEDMDSRY